MQHPPKAILRSLCVGLWPSPEQQRNLGRGDRRRDVDDQRYSGDSREQAQQEECSEDDLHYPDERGRSIRGGDTKLFEASFPERLGEEELLDTLGKEHPSDDDPDQDRCRWCLTCQDFLGECGYAHFVFLPLVVFH